MLSERELPQRRLVRVPDVVGLPLRKALLLVQQAGLRATSVLYKESYEEKDTVLEQRPQRGQMVYASEDVSLWVSRDSYIKWLPAIYQRSDTTGRNVVRDLLWIIQHLFGSIEQVLETIHLYFDSYETPEHFLPWLAGWSAMMLEADWPVNKKRRLIKKAMELYRLRGTVRGLKLFISLFTGFEPHLAENEWPFQGFRIGTSSTVGIDTVILPPVDKAHAFVCVMPHQFKDVTSESIVRLHEIIEMEKPAHTTYMLKFEEPRQAVEEREFYRIGISSGINIGQEVVTPLPIDQKTGEPELPTETMIPEQRPEPSIYELFGTKKRLLPPVDKAPKADNAPVEGKEITSSKYGFDDAAREFKLDDIMRELLARAGLGEGGGSGAPSGEPTAGAGEGQPPSGEAGGGATISSESSISGSGGLLSISNSGIGGSSGGSSSGSSGGSSGSSGGSSGGSGGSSGSSGGSVGSSGGSAGSSGGSAGSSGGSAGGGSAGSSGGASGGRSPAGGGGRAGKASAVGAEVDYGRAGGSAKVVGSVAGGGGRGPKIEVEVDPLTEFEGILAAAEAKQAGLATPGDAQAADSPAGSEPAAKPGGPGLAGLSDAPTAILGQDAASQVHGALGVRNSGGPRIEVEVDRQETERDAPAPSPGSSGGPSSAKPDAGRDDSKK
jgi:phage tail-like protein